MLKHRRLSQACGFLVVGIALVALYGWVAGILSLRNAIPGTPQTTPLTALLLITLGLSLNASARHHMTASQRWRRVCWILSGATVLAGLWVLAEYVVGGLPRIELQLFRETLLRSSSRFPGRPSPHSAATFVLLGSAVGLSVLPRAGERLPMVLTATLGTAIPWVVVFGYATFSNPLYSLSASPDTGMSPITALSLLIVCVGLAGLHPDDGPLGLLRSRSAGGTVARLLLPLALGLPILLAWIVFWLQGIDPAREILALTFIMAVMALLFAAMVMWIGFLLRRREIEARRQAARREALLAELQRSMSDLREMRENLVTVCAWSHRILDHGEWLKFEEFLGRRLGVTITHGISELALREEFAKDLEGTEAETDRD